MREGVVARLFMSDENVRPPLCGGWKEKEVNYGE